jgi:hypothetical protein
MIFDVIFIFFIYIYIFPVFLGWFEIIQKRCEKAGLVTSLSTSLSMGCRMELAQWTETDITNCWVWPLMSLDLQLVHW